MKNQFRVKNEPYNETHSFIPKGITMINSTHAKTHQTIDRVKNAATALFVTAVVVQGVSNVVKTIKTEKNA